MFLHCGLIVLFFGGAVLSFLYLLSNNRLDMDEEPKYQMMKGDD